MLKCLRLGQTCCFGELSLRDELLKNLSFRRFWCNFCTFFERFRSKFQHNQRKKRAMDYIFWREQQCSASKTLQNDSKGVEKFQHLRFCATCVLCESFQCQNVIKRSTMTEVLIHFKENLQTSVGKWLKFDRKKSKVWKFLSISDIFSEFFFEIGKFR